MQILYDTQIFLSQKIGGISRYHYELFKGMKQLGCDVKTAGLFVRNQYVLENKNLRKSFVHDPFCIFKSVNNFMLKRAVQNLPENAVFHPSNTYDFLNNEIPQVKNLTFTIHDMIVEKQNIDFGKNKLYYAQHAKKIIAVSETTKKDIIDLFGIDGNKIDVIYHGSSLNKQMVKKPNAAIPEQFLLYVGERSGYKNFINFVRAATPLLKKYNDLHLLCAGKKPFNKQEISVLQELGVTDKVISFSKIDDNTLAYLYCKAAAFVFPSLFEGFGIPILEAWACNAPVILSDNACFREVAAEAACYFDPLSQDSMTNEIEEVLKNNELRQDLILKGTSRLRLFSWEKTVEQTHKLYQSLL